MRRWTESGASWFAPFLVAAVVGIGGCGDGPNRPTIPDPPELTCPAPLTVTGVLGGMQPITYPTPMLAGGALPVTTVCTPASGSAFTLGTTVVGCTATDARQRRATCSFAVALSGLSLSVRRFLAFGDSVTAGEDGRTLQIRPTFIDPVRSYPAVLQGTLIADFPMQSPTVTNAGVGGELATEGVARLQELLRSQPPDALLLLEGYNDLLNFGVAAADTVVAALRTDIRNARIRGVQHVFVSTLTPPRRATGPRNRAVDIRAIQETNARLIAMVGAENAMLVNAYDAFIGREQELVGDDGLHLTAAGNQVLAGLFYARIRSAGLASLMGGN